MDSTNPAVVRRFVRFNPTVVRKFVRFPPNPEDPDAETDDTGLIHADPTGGYVETDGPGHGREAVMRTDGVESPEPDLVGEPNIPQEIPIRCVLDLNVLSGVGGCPTGSTFEDLVVAGPDGMPSHLEPLETEKGTSIGLSMYGLILLLLVFYCYSVIFVFYLLLRRVAPF